MALSEAAREEAAQILERIEVFEDETSISYTWHVDPAYREIVQQMASAMWDHDHKASEAGLFPTGDPYMDDPYMCRADDALRESLPLLRAKFAADLRASS